jgi:septal ring factor EnvC (AmiA/AmiB activator)
VSRLAERARELELERASKREVLAGLRADGARERGALDELEAAAKTLEQTLVRLGATPPARPSRPLTEPFTNLRGRLPAPVSAPVARGFGKVVDAEFLTAIFRKGIDFAAPAGAPVRAVAPGEVRFAGWFKGYGKMVILDHGEGYFTVCAHLDEIHVAMGDTVAADQPLGTVGDTGTLGGPLLYFEIRHGSEPQDPSRWLAGGTGLE